MTKGAHPSINAQEQSLLADYELYLKLERGLSGNTLDAYMRDIDKLSLYLSSLQVPLVEATPELIHSFMCELFDLGIHPSSQARILSGIRAFFKFLVLEEKIATDPTELVQRPSLPHRLPYVPTIEDINDMTENVLLVVRSKEGKERLIPAEESWIVELDEVKKQIVMNLPEGLIDLE